MNLRIFRTRNISSSLSLISLKERAFHSRIPCYSESKLTDKQKSMLSKGVPKQKPIPGVKDIILVCSGKGGVGKSTVAVNLSVALANSENNLSIGLLDCDVFGPSVPLMMNLHDEPLATEDKKIIPVTNYNVKCMSMGLLMSDSSAAIWRGLMVMSAMETLMRKVDWGFLDCLVIDTPPGTGDTLLSLIQNLPISGVVVVTTPQKAAWKVAARGATMLKKLNVPLVGIALNMSSTICPNCSHKFSVFQNSSFHLSEEIGAQIICEIPLDPRIADLGDSGTPIVVADPQSAQAQSYKTLSSEVYRFIKSNPQRNSSSDQNLKMHER